ncbi:MAG: NAD(+) diphosphatase [Deltaproteobacteria bacterium]|nr:MAG: NAD(+) diphosphatase [Deltaproteobacteria bacterium]
MEINSKIVDRAAVRRRDAAWLKARKEDPDTRFVPCWRSRSLFAAEDDPRSVLLSAAELGSLLAAAPVLVFLGLVDGHSCFALDLPADDEGIPRRLSAFGGFKNLRRLLPVVNGQDYALLAYARGMIFWHQRHRYCGVCGAPTVSREGGHLLVCSRPACGTQHFPRTDPAVIMRICRGEDCLMARQSSWPEGMYSVLAGFVEPGETLEDAVRREVREEAGIEICSVEYFASQPWPFPGSLMLGFTAEFAAGEIFCSDHELEEVRWFSREDIRRGLEAGSLSLPFKGTLSRRLIADWLEADGSGVLVPASCRRPGY